MSETKSRFIGLEVEDVHVALAMQYEEAVQSLVDSMGEAKLGPEFGWHASQYNMAYSYAFPLQSLDDLDPATGATKVRFGELLKAVDPEAAKKFASGTSKSVHASRLSILERVPEFNYEASHCVVEAPKHAIVDMHRVRGDSVEKYKESIRNLLGAVRKVDYPISWSAYRVVVGEGKTFYGEGRIYYYVVPFDSPYQFYEEHSFAAALYKALGEDGSKELMFEERSCLLEIEALEHRWRSDMGYMAGKTW